MAHFWPATKLQPFLAWNPQILDRLLETDCARYLSNDLEIRDIATWWYLNSELPFYDIPNVYYWTEIRWVSRTGNKLKFSMMFLDSNQHNSNLEIRRIVLLEHSISGWEDAMFNWTIKIKNIHIYSSASYCREMKSCKNHRGLLSISIWCFKIFLRCLSSWGIPT